MNKIDAYRGKDTLILHRLKRDLNLLLLLMNDIWLYDNDIYEALS